MKCNDASITCSLVLLTFSKGLEHFFFFFGIGNCKVCFMTSYNLWPAAKFVAKMISEEHNFFLFFSFFLVLKVLVKSTSGFTKSSVMIGVKSLRWHLFQGTQGATTCTQRWCRSGIFPNVTCCFLFRLLCRWDQEERKKKGKITDLVHTSAPLNART